VPHEYVIQKPLGAGALHQIFSDVLELCRGGDDFSTERMNDTLSYVGRSAGFWHSVRGPPHGAPERRSIRSRACGVPAERLPRPVLRKL